MDGSTSERQGLLLMCARLQTPPHKYVGGGDFVDAYVNAYSDYASRATARADANADGILSGAEQRNLPGEVYSSVVALRSAIGTGEPAAD